MSKLIPLNVFERLEREWRMIDPDRPHNCENSKCLSLPEKQVKLVRFDEDKVLR